MRLIIFLTVILLGFHCGGGGNVKAETSVSDSTVVGDITTKADVGSTSGGDSKADVETILNISEDLADLLGLPKNKEVIPTSTNINQLEAALRQDSLSEDDRNSIENSIKKCKNNIQKCRINTSN